MKIQRIDSGHGNGSYHVATASHTETRSGSTLVLTMTAGVVSPLTPTDINSAYSNLKTGSEDLGRVFSFFARDDRPMEPRWGYIRMSDRGFQDCGTPNEDTASAAREMGVSQHAFEQALGRFVTICVQGMQSWRDAALELQSGIDGLPEA